jgi:hypothetical protein
MEDAKLLNQIANLISNEGNDVLKIAIDHTGIGKSLQTLLIRSKKNNKDNIIHLSPSDYETNQRLLLLTKHIVIIPYHILPVTVNMPNTSVEVLIINSVDDQVQSKKEKCNTTSFTLTQDGNIAFENDKKIDELDTKDHNFAEEVIKEIQKRSNKFSNVIFRKLFALLPGKRFSHEVTYHIVLYGNRPLSGKLGVDESIMIFSNLDMAERFIEGYLEYYSTPIPLSATSLTSIEEIWSLLHLPSKDHKEYSPPFGLVVDFDYNIRQAESTFSIQQIEEMGIKGLARQLNLDQDYLRQLSDSLESLDP